MLVYGDLHIHIGRTREGQPVKVTASPQLNLEQIPQTAKEKGLGLIGLVDAACCGVLRDLQRLLHTGQLKPLTQGGYLWQGLLLLLGHEVEIAHKTGKEAHFVAFFPDLTLLERYAEHVAPCMTNPFLSTQKLRMSGDAWLKLVVESGGEAIAAHAFTPHKGVYGNCVRKLGEMFAHAQLIAGLELGLSANTSMAAQIADTHSYAYISNSDAHSLTTIGREFTAYDLPSLGFRQWAKVLKNLEGGIVATHGLDPLLGKYYRSFCRNCQLLAEGDDPVLRCPRCGGPVVCGVWDRLREIRDMPEKAAERPPYISHVPLMMLPGVGPRTYRQLLKKLGTEIEVMYTVSLEAISDVAGPVLSEQIAAVRTGNLHILPGGGGKYGRITKAQER